MQIFFLLLRRLSNLSSIYIHDILKTFLNWKDTLIVRKIGMTCGTLTGLIENFLHHFVYNVAMPWVSFKISRCNWRWTKQGGLKTSTVSESSSHLAHEVAKRDKALLLAPLNRKFLKTHIKMEDALVAYQCQCRCSQWKGKFPTASSRCMQTCTQTNCKRHTNLVIYT